MKKKIKELLLSSDIEVRKLGLSYLSNKQYSADICLKASMTDDLISYKLDRQGMSFDILRDYIICGILRDEALDIFIEVCYEGKD